MTMKNRPGKRGGLHNVDKLLILQVRINSGSALLTGAHGKNYGSSTGDRIAAGKNAIAGGHFILIDDQTALACIEKYNKRHYNNDRTIARCYD